YRRLRWRLVGIQVLVVLIGVSSVLLAVRLLIGDARQTIIEPALRPYIADETDILKIEDELLAALGRTVLIAVSVAGVGAIGAGLVASFLLWRTMVIPLRTLAAAGQRIADGRYSERVPIPVQGGEALQQVAINFNEMASSLEQVEEQRITLIGNVTHELRTPLTGLKGLIEGVEDGIYKPEPKTFKRIGREMDRLTRLIDDIQNLSRIEAAAIHLEFRSFSLEELVRQVTSHMRGMASASDITLELLPAGQPLQIWADSDRTAQILTNLINNAIRYTPAGGRVTIAFDRRETVAEVQVIDNGIGIPPEQLKFIFERFYRVDQSRSRQSGGSGVGLTISRHLAWAMAGELTAHSEGEGQGTVFTLTLPLAT
ncbi:MAG: HAMP domain-containing protein, partial [Anaerolineales bacterium]|nr:HAMP domain-containing protein [Anaerolineales bacterium]